MTLADIWNIAGAVLASLGGGAAIVFGLSNFLGKIWAERLMAKERQVYARELEQLKNELKEASDIKIAAIEARLEIEKTALVREHSDRVTIYRASVDLIASMLSKIEMIMIGKKDALTAEELSQFENDRYRVYGYLAMHAPQSVMDAHDRLSELILEVIFDGKGLHFPTVRDAAILMLNEVRKDVGIHPEAITYNGTR